MTTSTPTEPMNELSARDLVTALMDGMGITDFREAALQVLRRDAAFHLKTLPDPLDWQAQHDELARTVQGVAEAALAHREDTAASRATHAEALASHEALTRAGISRAQKELRDVLDLLIAAEVNSRAPVVSRIYGDAQGPVMTALDALDRELAALPANPGPPQAAAGEGANIPPEIVEIVTLIGPAQWCRTPAHTPEEHGEGMARSVRLTAEHFNQGDEPQHMQMLVREGTDIVIGYVGTSPNSGQVTRALAGAWNHLHQLCVQKARGDS